MASPAAAKELDGLLRNKFTARKPRRLVFAARAKRSLAISFFMAAFTGPNQRNIPRQQLIDTLDDVLFGLRDELGTDKFPRPASEYLDDWAATEKSWLRKYYAQGQDEPVYDLTATTEDVVRWVESLRGRDFVATQSRLTSIFAVLKQLVQQSETDPEVRLAELQRQRAWFPTKRPTRLAWRCRTPL